MVENRRYISRSKLQPIGGIVEKIVSSLGLGSRYYGWQVVNNWSEIVGEHIARHSQAVRFDEGTLYVAIEDASWRNTILMDIENILKKIHQLPYGRGIKEIRLVSGKKGL